MVIYEVNLRIDNDVTEVAAGWIRQHIRTMLNEDGFETATWYFQDPEETCQVWTIHYRVASWRLLEKYLETIAPAMRADALERFGERMRAERRFLFERESFTPAE